MPSRRDRALEDLLDHAPTNRDEARSLERVVAFARRHEDPFDRELLPGHLTASALVASRDLDRVLLLHHRKLDLWLQCGGHADDGDPGPQEAAVREAREETGVEDVELHPSWPRLLDVDVHDIPASPRMPSHLHLDLRYVAVASPDAQLEPPEAEVKELRWFTWSEVESMPLDPGLQRLLAKTRALRSR